MKQRLAASATIATLVLIWLGFVIHRSPRFAGSRLGLVLGIAGAVLMTLPMLYVPVRRLPAIRKRLAPLVSVASVLKFHVATGFAGALLAILHTGHRFEHAIGIALVAMVLTISVSGYIGFELLRRLAARRGELTTLRTQLQSHVAASTRNPAMIREVARGIADAELDVKATQRIERGLRVWRTLHVLAAVLLFALLAVHIWSALYFGVRW